MSLKTFRKHYNELSQQWSNDMPATSSKKDSLINGKSCYKYHNSVHYVSGNNYFKTFLGTYVTFWKVTVYLD